MPPIEKCVKIFYLLCTEYHAINNRVYHAINSHVFVIHWQAFTLASIT